MDLHYSQTHTRILPHAVCFTTLWIYTILKQNCTKSVQGQFHYLMDLHYSQTCRPAGGCSQSFTTLWIYTILKPAAGDYGVNFVSLPYGFTLFSNNRAGK